MEEDEGKLNMELVKLADYNPVWEQGSSDWKSKNKFLVASRQLMYTVGSKEEEGGTEKQVNIRWKTPSTALNSGELKFYSTSTLPC